MVKETVAIKKNWNTLWQETIKKKWKIWRLHSKLYKIVRRHTMVISMSIATSYATAWGWEAMWPRCWMLSLTSVWSPEIWYTLPWFWQHCIIYESKQLVYWLLIWWHPTERRYRQYLVQSLGMMLVSLPQYSEHYIVQRVQVLHLDLEHILHNLCGS